ncbi:MAG: hypothetical protein K0S45_1992 [Nitrospira sp.]|jgi:hypothetical protein|nr:hypothetical protein [Nitrospira sp.]
MGNAWDATHEARTVPNERQRWAGGTQEDFT